MRYPWLAHGSDSQDRFVCGDLQELSRRETLRSGRHAELTFRYGLRPDFFGPHDLRGGKL